MSNSNAIKAMVALATCTAASAFVAPTHLGRTFPAPSVPSSQNVRQTPANRGEAVGALNGFSFPSIIDIFTREYAAAAAVAVPSCLVVACLRHNELRACERDGRACRRLAESCLDVFIHNGTTVLYYYCT